MSNQLATSGELIDYVEVRGCDPAPKEIDGKYYIVCEIVNNNPMDDDLPSTMISESELVMKQIPPEHVDYIKKRTIKINLLKE